MESTAFYELRCDEHAPYVQVDWDKHWELLREPSMERLAAEWPFCEAEISHKDGFFAYDEKSDVAYFAPHIPVFSNRALQHLRPWLQEGGVTRPIGTHFSAVLVRILDSALDLEKSNIRRFSSGKIMRIVTHHFRHDLPSNLHIFRLSEVPLASVYVSLELKEAASMAQIRGLSFLATS